MNESMERFGTVAFEPGIMAQAIRAGRPVVDEVGCVTWQPAPEINVALWLSMVPDVYREQAAMGAAEVGESLIGMKLTDEAVRHYCRELHRWIIANVEPEP